MVLERLPAALEQFVSTEDWDEARQVVEKNPQLLGDDALNLLAESIAGYRAIERNDVADYLEEHRAILERAREAGLDQAFQEADARAAAALEARRQQLAALRPSSPTPAQAVVWRLLEAEEPEEIDRILSDNAQMLRSEEAVNYVDGLLQQARQAGYGEALRFLRDYHELLRAYYELPPLMLRLQEFMSVPTWTEARDVLTHNPELLSDDAMRTMDSLIQEARAQGDQETADTLEIYRQVLKRSREVGPDLAVEEVKQPAEQAMPS